MTDALIQYTRAELKLGHAVADRDAMKEILANESQDLKVESEYLERCEHPCVVSLRLLGLIHACSGSGEKSR